MIKENDKFTNVLIGIFHDFQCIVGKTDRIAENVAKLEVATVLRYKP